MPDDGAAPGRWLTLPDACRALAVTDRTLRRRVAAGRYRTRRQGGRATVWIPDSERPDRPEGPESDRADATGRPQRPDAGALALPDRRIDAAAVAALATLAEAAMRRVATAEERAGIEARRTADHAAAAAMWQERARNLEAENARLHELLALPACEEPETPPWWRRIFRRR